MQDLMLRSYESVKPSYSGHGLCPRAVKDQHAHTSTPALVGNFAAHMIEILVTVTNCIMSRVRGPGTLMPALSEFFGTRSVVQRVRHIFFFDHLSSPDVLASATTYSRPPAR